MSTEWTETHKFLSEKPADSINGARSRTRFRENRLLLQITISKPLGHFGVMAITADVTAFLTSSGSPIALIDTFQAQNIDEQVLNSLTEAEFTSLVAETRIKHPEFTMTLGQQKKLWLKIVKFKQRRGRRSSSNYSESPSPAHGSPELTDAVITSFSNPGSPELGPSVGTPVGSGLSDLSRVLASSFEDGGLSRTTSARSMNNGSGGCCGRRSHSYCRLTLAAAYFVLAVVLTSVTMVFVHDRVPDQDKFPPLPDLMLENIPHIPGGFAVAEVLAVAMFIALAMVTAFHKHRVVIMRRFFAITGSIFLLRCCTMLCTSLSVPGVHLECRGMKLTWEGKIERILEIISGFGMSVAGVKTCGDYMFSGHTVVLTMFNFFLSEYTPRSWKFFHTMCWVANLFGIFFILAAHEHYTIDCLIAFYLSSRLFLYYHSLAHLNALRTEAKSRIEHWFPMFSYLEGNCRMVVPNEFEYPDCLTSCFAACRRFAVGDQTELMELSLESSVTSVSASNSGQGTKRFAGNGLRKRK